MSAMLTTRPLGLRPILEARELNYGTEAPRVSVLSRVPGRDYRLGCVAAGVHLDLA